MTAEGGSAFIPTRRVKEMSEEIAVKLRLLEARQSAVLLHLQPFEDLPMASIEVDGLGEVFESLSDEPGMEQRLGARHAREGTSNG